MMRPTEQPLNCVPSTARIICREVVLPTLPVTATTRPVRSGPQRGYAPSLADFDALASGGETSRQTETLDGQGRVGKLLRILRHKLDEVPFKRGKANGS